MVLEPTRRTVLKAAAAAAGAVAGCAAPPADDVRAPTESTTTEGTTPAETRTQTPEPRTDDFYIENFDEEERCVSVSVTDGTEPVLDGSYVLAGKQGARFEDAGEQGRTYAVRASVDGGDATEFVWDVDDCPFAGDDRDGGVVVRDGTPTFAANECDAVAVGWELAYRVEPTSDDCGATSPPD